MSKTKAEVPYLVIVGAFADIQNKVNELEHRYFWSCDSEEKQMLSIKIQGYEAILDQLTTCFRMSSKTPTLTEEDYALVWD
jgi:hypothetical protein